MKFKLFGKKEKKEKKSGGFREWVAKLSRGLMLPIAMLPIAGLFMGIGNAIATNCQTGFLHMLGLIINTPGNVIFSCLPVLFAIAIAITFTGDAGTAGLSAFVGWLVFCAIQSAMIIPVTTVQDGQTVISSYKFLYYTFDPVKFNAIFADNVGIKSLCTSVFGGLTVGFVVSVLYNKYKNIQLPTVLGFFSGVRFIPIVTFMSMIPLSLLFSLIWPIIGTGLFAFGQLLGSLSNYGGINAFLNDFISRSLNPFGLHHAFYTPLWYTAVGGSVPLANSMQFHVDGNIFTGFIVNGNAVTNATWGQLAQALGYTGSIDTSINGDQSIWMFFSQIAGKNVILTSVDGAQTEVHLTFGLLSKQFEGVFAGQYMEGRYAIMILALPAAALAMLLAVPKGPNRKVAASIILSAALTSFLTGITEPIEFTFLFLAPWLYWGVHAVLCGVSAMLMVICQAHLGMTFSGGIIDFFIYGVLPDISKMGANCYWVFIVGSCLAVIYFFVFYWAIVHFDIKTPGRDGNSEVKLYTKKDYLAKQDQKKNPKANEMNSFALQVIEALGGKENIKNVDACITKLRVQVVDRSKANKEQLMKLGARGVVYPSAQSVYAVFGTQADRIKNEIKEVLNA